MSRWTRRALLAGVGASAAGLLGCEASDGPGTQNLILRAAEALTLRSQRFLLAGRPLAREYTVAELSPVFPINGSRVAPGDDYRRLVETGFRDWRLRVHGLVRQPLSLSLVQLRALAARSQITMHSCDEGWNAIGQWKGVPLGTVLTLAGLGPEARYVVFHCLDKKPENGEFYYESIDLFDAYHPQTVLAYEMNGHLLPVEYGAPLRLRVETQIGYKNAKYIDRIEVVSKLNGIGGGRGGWWEDTDDAVWYAGQ